MSLVEAALFEEIIKLQLRKPKNWNWELSTSKSSPHIAVPIIQLYNSKGQLVLETKDSRVPKRQSWHSSDIPVKQTTTTNVKKEYKEPADRRLQRCRSDTLDTEARKKRFANKLDSIKTREKQRSANNKLTKSSSAVLDNLISKRGVEATNENRKLNCYNENSIIGENGKCKQIDAHAEKSRSDMLQPKGKID